MLHFLLIHVLCFSEWAYVMQVLINTIALVSCRGIRCKLAMTIKACGYFNKVLSR
jgi:hypothetical protein